MVIRAVPLCKASLRAGVCALAAFKARSAGDGAAFLVAQNVDVHRTCFFAFAAAGTRKRIIMNLLN